MISASALISAIPLPPDRGSYMSVSSSIQQFSGGVAAAFAGLIVVQQPDGSLLHFDRIGYVLVASTLISLTMMYRIKRRIEVAEPAAAAAAADTRA